MIPLTVAAQSFDFGTAMTKFFDEMGFTFFFSGEGWKNAVMIGIACFLLYLAIKKEYEPLLLLPIAFGMLLSNIPGAGLFHTSMWNDEFLNPDSPFFHSYRHVLAEGGLLDVLYIGVKTGIYPCLIFLGVGAMTDFGPLIANPKSLLLGAGAQLGIFITFIGAILLGFNAQEAGSIAIIGGADGPTAILTCTRMAKQ
ncbi:MAG: sodium ion-translocating decarboxylase subunit beta, partial [Bacteroidales bacterium]|nr:sodium ion-translocating decarboxylase subunit beta [Bacteroidales bacterium]